MRYLISILLAIFCLLPGLAQDAKKQEAKEFFFHQRYADALSVLGSTRELIKNDQEARFLLAACYYHLNQLEEAQAIFQNAIHAEKNPYPECWLYMGKIYHAMHQFSKAAGYYKDYLRQVKANHPNREMVWDDIRRCSQGLSLQYLPATAVAENMGRAINTPQDEFAPIISPNFGNRLYFSSIRHGNIGGRRDESGRPDNRLGAFYSDMFTCELETAHSWGKARAMHHLLNSPQHDILLDFNDDGSVLYYFKGWKPSQGQIYLDTFQKVEQRRLSSDPFPGPLNPAIGDGTPQFVNDTLVYFSSRRPGGYGGLDLYATTFSAGRWTAPKNLGPIVNTPYDETSPFMARDQKTLYFSSNHPQRSMGGLDIMKAVFNDRSSRWTEPENIGMPVNSAGDDAYFRIAKDGFTAFFSSSRKDALGQRDLYIAYFHDFLPEMELPVVYQQPPGNVPSPKVEETVSASREGLALEPAGKELGSEMAGSGGNSSNSFSPSYFRNASPQLDQQAREKLGRIALLLKDNPGLHLIITAYNAESKPLSERLFSGINLAERAAEHLMVQEQVNGERLFMRSGAIPPASLRSSSLYSLEFSFKKPEDSGSKGLVVPDLESGLSSAVPKHPLNSNLLYKVQVSSLSGAFQGPLLEQYPDAMVEKVPNLAYYRYTLGAFNQHAEAEAFRQKLIQAGHRSAYVVAYLYGLRASRMMARRHIIHFPDLKNYAD